ncbi:MAG: Thivi_2564 family membrane protein [Gammaproteobacteria bacterium]
MSLVSIVIVLIVVGFLLWLINTYIPMARPIKTILNVVVIIGVILWLLSSLGVIQGLGSFRLK